MIIENAKITIGHSDFFTKKQFVNSEFRNVWINKKHRLNSYHGCVFINCWFVKNFFNDNNVDFCDFKDCFLI